MMKYNRFGHRAGAVLVPACLLAWNAIGQDAASVADQVEAAAEEVAETGTAISETTLQAAEDGAAFVENVEEAAAAAGEKAADVADAAWDKTKETVSDAATLEEGTTSAADEVENSVEESVETEAQASDSPETEDVIVTVNGSEFTRADASEALEKRLSALGGQVPPDQLDNFKTRMQDQIVEDFINRTLLESEVAKSDVSIQDAEIDAFIATAEEGLPDGFTLEQYLEQRGLSIDDMRRDVVFQLGAKKLIDEHLGQKLDVTDEEVEEFFEREKSRFGTAEQVHARHVLVKVDADATDEQRSEKKETIAGLREKVVEGEDFATVAAASSDCPSGQQGGDLGTFDSTRMVPPFSEAAFSQEIGEVGPVIETQFGYHFIEVLEKTEGNEASLDDARDQIVGVLQNQRRGDAFQNYMENLRNGSDIVYAGR